MATKRRKTAGVYITSDGRCVVARDLYADEDQTLSTMQKLVGGTIGLLPSLSEDNNFMCYVNDEGLLNPSSQTNWIASYVLEYLGFDIESCMGGVVRGTAVIVGNNDGGLDDPTADAVVRVCKLISEDTDRELDDLLTKEELGLLFKTPKAQVTAEEKKPQPESAPAKEEPSSDKEKVIPKEPAQNEKKRQLEEGEKDTTLEGAVKKARIERGYPSDYTP